MLRNYLLTAYRNLKRQKAFSAINILGLGVGMAAFLLILQYIRHELSYDRFHEKGERIYRVGTSFYKEGVPTEYATTFLGLGPAMKADFPEISEFTRLCFRRGVVSYKAGTFTEENLYFADPGFLQMFSFRMQPGSTATLKAPNEVIISQSAARKYFGQENPLGKVMKLKSRLFEQDVTVRGVFADLPTNSHLRIDFLASVQTLVSHLGNERLNGWDSIDHYTYVLLREEAYVQNLNAKFPAFLDKYLGTLWGESGVGLGQNRIGFVLTPLLNIHLHSRLQDEAETNGDIAIVRLLMLIAAFILLLACINYINLSTARAMERAKEVAVRKVIGASRLQIIRQFFLESLLLNLVGIILAFTLAQVASPWINSLSGKAFYVFNWQDTTLWFSLVSIFIATTFLSGIYPAFILSSFRPVVALKGKVHATTEVFSFRKMLIVLQFVVAILLVSGTYAVYKQMQFMQEYNLGMNIDQLLVVKAPLLREADSVFSQKAEVFKHQLLSQANINKVTVSSSVPNTGMYGTIGAVGRLGTKPENEDFRFHHIYADTDFISTYGLQVLAGRSFSKDLSTDKNNLILSERAIQILGFQSPEAAVNQRIQYEGEKTIIGVIKDFHQYSVAKEVIPIILELRTNDRKFFSAKVNTSKLTQTIASVQESYEKLYPGSPFEYFFMDEHFASQYEADKRFGQVFSVFSGMAIFIACLGLFGLVSYTTIQRGKEIGVRKVLGATLTSLLLLLSRDFMKLVVLALVIACPVAYWSIQQWLSGYASHTPIALDFFLIPGISVLLIAFFTISYQTIKSARENPVKALRNE
ncbi:FtsX-like permease family protein [Rhodocytophaga rosea]|uniref:FtsX-like permease family protein n=1 Tax=Rhodocytophaga rosea TaxID=2704465 RepID=A0A6C0GG98_9BACT|nr:ABC transporter permease [Rhodocytophaga rosea]QHT67036.1 FtsX-like permease family protein [Rhodocytophaga rosea]